MYTPILKPQIAGLTGQIPDIKRHDSNDVVEEKMQRAHDKEHAPCDSLHASQVL